MANNTKEKKDVSKEQVIMQTEADWEKLHREKTKERVGRVLRVVGLITSIFVIGDGFLNTFFELSLFGRLWDAIVGNNVCVTSWEFLMSDGIHVYDDWMKLYSPIIPEIACTVIIIAAILGLVYLITFSIIDIINFSKGIYYSLRTITRDLSGQVEDSIKETAPKPKKKKLFAGDDVEEGEKPTAPKKEKTPKRRKESNGMVAGYTSEELDALLRGETIEGKELPTDTTEEDKPKDLFVD